MLQKNGWKYIITRPNIIIGVARGNFMNFAISLAIYASIRKAKGEPLLFPGNETAWNAIVDHSDAPNNARFQLWTSTNENIRSEIFNIHDDDDAKFRTLWENTEKYFGFKHHEQTFNTKPYKHGDILISQFSIGEYVQNNKDVWDRLAKRDNLDSSAFDYGTWGFIDFVLGRAYDDHASMNKARKYGWTTKIDTSERYLKCFDRLRQMKIIPSE